jgi:hypothetical protein
MYAELKKIQVIEEVLKLNNAAPLEELEKVLLKWKKNKVKKPTIYDFVGVLSTKETKQMKKTITETVEMINADEWK